MIQENIMESDVKEKLKSEGRGQDYRKYLEEIEMIGKMTTGLDSYFC